MRTRVLILMISFALSGLPLRAQSFDSLWEDASKRAAAEQKLVLLQFVAPEAEPGGLPRGGVHTQVADASGAGRYIELRINELVAPAMFGRYRVVELPTWIVINPDGTELDRLAGAQSASELAHMVKSVLEGNPQIRQLQTKAHESTKVEDRGRLGDAYLKRARYADALIEYQWCLEKGRNADAAGYRRLLKMIVGRVKELEGKLPAAQEVLSQCRQEVETQLNPAIPDTYAVAFTVNEAMGDPARNAALFEKLPAPSELRCELLPQVFEGLVQVRNYRAAALTIDLETLVGRLYPCTWPAIFPMAAMCRPDTPTGLPGKRRSG